MTLTTMKWVLFFATFFCLLCEQLALGFVAFGLSTALDYVSDLLRSPDERALDEANAVLQHPH